jgi:signal peptide peptidase SppA
MNNQENISGDEDINKESNLRVRKDWHNFKKVIFNRDYLIVFIAVSALIIDLVIINNFAPYFKDKLETNKNNHSKINIVDNNKESDKNASSTDDNCNVMGINLHGDLITYIPKSDYSDTGNLKVDETASESIYFAVKSAEKNDKIKAIILEVDSTGGDPVAAEEIERVLKISSKPVIAYIRRDGDSAAYWSATAAERIFASPSSAVGSIGVTSSYLDNVKANQKNGYTFNDLATGKFKNTMNGNKPLTAEEKALIMKDLNETYDLFIKTVAENRKLDVNKVKAIANGWAYTGTEALSMGLIDELGGLDEVNAYLKNNVLNGAEANVCW